MSSSVPTRSLSLFPFFAADGVLLFTAFMIAWRSSGEFTSGALAGVALCTALGAILMVLPFVLNDARVREFGLAERQRELVELVKSSTATASRWGSQWAAAATGLDDAASLAARNIAAAERLPAIFQEKIDALTERLDQAELAVRRREEQAARQDEALAGRVEQAAAVALALEQTLAGFGRMEGDLRERHVALASILAEIPAAAERAHVAREALDERLAAVTAQAQGQIDAHVAPLLRFAGEAEARLATTSAALTSRLADVEAALGTLIGKLEQAKALDPTSLPTPIVEENATVGAVGLDPLPSEPQADPESAFASRPVACVLVAPEQTVMSVVETVGDEPVVSGPDESKAERVTTIMDPFYIPTDGYSALAEAMDESRPS